MLRTYFLQKFRKAAPYLVVLQLFAFIVFGVYQKYSESKVPDLERDTWVLNENNAIRWNELEFEVQYFEYKIGRERVGEDLAKMATSFLAIAEKYRNKVGDLQSKIYENQSISSIQEEQKLLQLANDSNWNQQIEDLLFAFQREMKLLAEWESLDVGYAWETLLERGYHQPKTKNNDKYPYQSLEQVELDLGIAQANILNYTKQYINLILGRIAMCGNVKFNRHRVEVIPKSYKVEQGDLFEAEIVLIEEAELIPQVVIVEGDTLKMNRNNRAVYQTKTKKRGRHWLRGEIHTKDETGRKETHQFGSEYFVEPQ